MLLTYSSSNSILVPAAISASLRSLLNSEHWSCASLIVNPVSISCFSALENSWKFLAERINVRHVLLMNCLSQCGRTCADSLGSLVKMFPGTRTMRGMSLGNLTWESSGDVDGSNVSCHDTSHRYNPTDLRHFLFDKVRPRLLVHLTSFLALAKPEMTACG